MAKAEGIEEVVIGLTYSISPVHTHAYYAERAAALADCADMDRLYLKDPGGLLTVDAVRELAPAFVPAAAGRPLELHSHCTIGLAPQVYLEGVRAGFGVLHTAAGPLGRGTSQPEALSTVRNVEASGYEHALDLGAQAVVSTTSPSWPAPRGCRPASRASSMPRTTATSCPAGWSPPPGGCSASCAGPSCSSQVLEEVTRVRAEMGYPIIVTPVSQFIASQAARNVIDGERWANVSDETVRYFLGHYGDRRRRSIRTSPTGCAPAAGGQAGRSGATVARRRPGAVRGAHLRGGAAAAPDDAGRAGRRDGRRARCGGRRPARRCPPRARALIAGHAAGGAERRPSLRSAEIISADERVVWRRG